MFKDVRVNVTLDKSTVQSLLNGLYQGARRKAIRVICGADGNFYIESKELRIVIALDDAKQLSLIHLHNDRMVAELDPRIIDEMGFTNLCKDIIKELSDKYSPTAHSLADNIYAFAKTYSN